MRINSAINNLWTSGFFLQHKKPIEVEKKLLDKYGITCSNILMQLKSCNFFLRKENKGWVQKFHADDQHNKKKEGIDYFKLLNIHPEIEKVSKKLFLDNHFSQAIFEAYKKVNNMVKEKSNRKDLDGKNLMLTVFSVNNPTLTLNNLVSQSDKDEQEGFMHLYAGAIMGIRNPKGHDEIVQTDFNRTLKYLMFASLLCERLGECKIKTNN